MADKGLYSDLNEFIEDGGRDEVNKDVQNEGNIPQGDPDPGTNQGSSIPTSDPQPNSPNQTPIEPEGDNQPDPPNPGPIDPEEDAAPSSPDQSRIEPTDEDFENEFPSSIPVSDRAPDPPQHKGNIQPRGRTNEEGEDSEQIEPDEKRRPSDVQNEGNIQPKRGRSRENPNRVEIEPDEDATPGGPNQSPVEPRDEATPDESQNRNVINLKDEAAPSRASNAGNIEQNDDVQPSSPSQSQNITPTEESEPSASQQSGNVTPTEESEPPSPRQKGNIDPSEESEPSEPRQSGNIEETEESEPPRPQQRGNIPSEESQPPQARNRGNITNEDENPQPPEPRRRGNIRSSEEPPSSEPVEDADISVSGQSDEDSESSSIPVEDSRPPSPQHEGNIPVDEESPPPPKENDDENPQTGNISPNEEPSPQEQLNENPHEGNIQPTEGTSPEEDSDESPQTGNIPPTQNSEPPSPQQTGNVPPNEEPSPKEKLDEDQHEGNISPNEGPSPKEQLDEEPHEGNIQQNDNPPDEPQREDNINEEDRRPEEPQLEDNINEDDRRPEEPSKEDNINEADRRPQGPQRENNINEEDRRPDEPQLTDNINEDDRRPEEPQRENNINEDDRRPDEPEVQDNINEDDRRPEEPQREDNINEDDRRPQETQKEDNINEDDRRPQEVSTEGNIEQEDNPPPDFNTGARQEEFLERNEVIRLREFDTLFDDTRSSFDDRGILRGGISLENLTGVQGAQEPFILRRPEAGGGSSVIANAKRFDTRTVPLGSAIEDTVRMGKFFASGKGIVYNIKKAFLQLLNPRKRTRIYDPTSPIKTAASGMAIRPGQGTTRHLDGESSVIGGIASNLGAPASSDYEDELEADAVDTEWGTMTGSLFWLSPVAESPLNDGLSGQGARGRIEQLQAQNVRNIKQLHSTSGNEGVSKAQATADVLQGELGTGYLFTRKYDPMGGPNSEGEERMDTFHPSFPYIGNIDSSGTRSQPTSSAYNAPEFANEDEQLLNVTEGDRGEQEASFPYVNPSRTPATEDVVDGDGNVQKQFQNDSTSEAYYENRVFGEDLIPLHRGVPDQEESRGLPNYSARNEEGEKTKRIDWINRLEPIVGEDVDPDQEEFGDGQHRDLIPFKFYDIENSGLIVFRAFLEGISDNLSPEWSQKDYAGRPEQAHLYSGYTNSISFSFQVVPFSEEEFKAIWKKVNYLKGLTTPAGYTFARGGGSYMVPPQMRLTIGDLWNHVHGYINSLTISVNDDMDWEIDPEVGRLPRGIEIDVDWTVIENRERPPMALQKYYDAPFIDQIEDATRESPEAREEIIPETQDALLERAELEEPRSVTKSKESPGEEG